MVLTVILQVLRAMLWSAGLPGANIIIAWAHFASILDSCWGISGPCWAQDRSNCDRKSASCVDVARFLTFLGVGVGFVR